MKSVEIVLRREWGERKENDGGIHLRCIIGAYVSIRMYPSVQLLHANLKEKQHWWRHGSSGSTTAWLA
jgi:hypothetical protein